MAEEADPHLSLASFEGVVESHNVSPGSQQGERGTAEEQGASCWAGNVSHLVPVFAGCAGQEEAEGQP